MSCDRWMPLLLHLADDNPEGLDTRERADLQTHLTECDGCRQALEQQRSVRTALQHRSDAAVPAGFAARVTAQIELQIPWVDLFRWRTWTYRLIPVTAGLLMFALLTAPNGDTSSPGSEVSNLTDAWAFGTQASETLPAFAWLGQEDVSGDELLDLILSTEPDELLTVGDPS